LEFAVSSAYHRNLVRAVIQYTSWLVGLPLELLIIGALLRGPYRRFPLLLAFNIALFLTTVIEVSVNQAYFAGIRFTYSRATYYWVDEGIRQGLLFSVVLSWAYLATGNLRSRNLVRFAIIAGGVVLAATSFLIHHQFQSAAGVGHVGQWRWMTLWVRDMAFAAAILDLAVWTLLLASRHKDTQLLLLTGGLGIQFAGDAIGESLRSLFKSSAISPGDIVEVLTSLATYWIWWQALRRRVAVTTPAGVALPPQRDETGVAN
jgi:hypothetical protein